MYRGIQIIAEVKTHSPFGLISQKGWDELFEVANAVGDIISIHTDARWGGSFDVLKYARSLTKKPLLAKGIHQNDSDIERAIDCGADFVLVVGRIPKINIEKCFLEPNSLSELNKIDPSLHVVWNSRDLETGGVKKETFEEARKLFSGWLCQASFIKTVGDIKEDANAVLVGEHLEDFADSISCD